MQEPPHRYAGEGGRYDVREDGDHVSQPRALFELFDEVQQGRLFSNIAEAMQGVPDEIVERQCGLFDRVHPDYGRGVREALRRLAEKSGG